MNSTEFDEAAESLVRASQLIQQRTAERERAEAACRQSEELNRFNAELKRSEAESRALAKELAAIMDAVPAITLIAHDPDCRRVTSNRAGYDFYRLPPGANASKSAPEGERLSNYRVLRDGRELSPDELPVQMAAATGREVRDCECTIAFDDGSSRSIFGNAVPLFDETGKIRGSVGAYIDITERKRAEEALKEREQHLRTILQTTQDAFCLVDTQGKLLDVNDACCVMCGYTREELLQMRVPDLECADSEQEIFARAQRIIRQGRDRFESQYRRRDGQIIEVESSVTFQDIRGGRFVCFLRDITERKRAEQSLRESEERFRKLLEKAPLPLGLVDEAGVITFRNERFITVFGYTDEDVPTLVEWWQRAYPDPEYRQWAIERWDTAVRVASAEGRDIEPMESNITCKSGDARVVEVWGIALGKEFLGTFIDITERKQEEGKRRGLEQQLRQSQKMEAVGRLAGGIAHDFNNLLMVIQSYAEMLHDSIPADNALRKHTQEIMKAADRAASLTRQMLAFSRKQILSPVVLDLNAVIDETAKMLKRLIGEDIEFRVRSAGVTLGSRG